MALSVQIGYIVPQEYEVYHIGPGYKKNTDKWTKTNNITSPSMVHGYLSLTIAYVGRKH